MTTGRKTSTESVNAMADNRYEQTLERLSAYGQEHLLDGFDALSAAERERLLDDIDDADPAQMAELYQKALRHQQGGEVSAAELTPLAPVDADKLPAEDYGLSLVCQGT